MKKLLLLLTCCIGVFSKPSVASSVNVDNDIVILAGVKNGVYSILAQSVCSNWRRYKIYLQKSKNLDKYNEVRDINCRFINTSGSIENIIEIVKGTGNIAIIQSDWENAAYYGKGAFDEDVLKKHNIDSFSSDKFKKNIESLFSFHSELLTVVANKNAKSEECYIKEGKRIRDEEYNKSRGNRISESEIVAKIATSCSKPDNQVNSIYDLKGLVVAVGASDSGTFYTFKAVVNVNWKEGEDYIVLPPQADIISAKKQNPDKAIFITADIDEGHEMLIAGTVDAAVFVIGHPNFLIDKISITRATDRDFTILPIFDDSSDSRNKRILKFIDDNPYYAKTVFSDIYPRLDEEGKKTISMRSSVVISRKMKDELVVNFLEAFFDERRFNRIVQTFRAFRQMANEAIEESRLLGGKYQNLTVQEIYQLLLKKIATSNSILPRDKNAIDFFNKEIK